MYHRVVYSPYDLHMNNMQKHLLAAAQSLQMRMLMENDGLLGCYR